MLAESVCEMLMLLKVKKLFLLQESNHITFHVAHFKI